jgi:DNA-directed RNA polymerase subunit K/omega
MTKGWQMVPVYEIINYSGNRYLLTKAIMKRARQINFIGDEELESYNGKIASLSLKQILNEEVKYTLMEEEKKLKNI